ncbi:hypothetical protein SAMN06295885_0450 [Rathayibacter oskolensis]|uniref:Uncharacterized protein n=1 Tax=Rathayibacter oskolensis TaxID=1891671 RepID=A0A1X7N074_9MICO|nr:hypothetical protein [Rathayibacter oskolensis]SMH30644.1 hypothetical protein SAMN06295885_0450 [Rathayibacter oskolensis]
MSDLVVHDERIRGKVAEVVSDREVILNRGSDHGIEEGMYFAILDGALIGVTDPDDEDSDLGSLRVVKIVVRAVQVAPRMTLARTFRSRTVNVGGVGGGGFGILTAALEAPRYEERVEKLTLAENAPRKIDPKDSVVGRGDPFESADDDEVEDVRSVTVWEPR